MLQTFLGRVYLVDGYAVSYLVFVEKILAQDEQSLFEEKDGARASSRATIARVQRAITCV